MNILVFVFAAALGAVLRFWLERTSADRLGNSIPWGTLTANVLGSAVLGWFAAGDFTESATVFAASFSGAFTTFGGFIAQSAERMKSRDTRPVGLAYLIATLVLSLGAAWSAFALNS